MSFKIYYVNHNTYADVRFKNVFNALEFAEKTVCECRIETTSDDIVVSWRPTTGIQWHISSWLTTKETAFLLGLSQSRIIQFCQGNRLGEMFGDVWLITLTELEKFARIPRPEGKRIND